MGGRYRVKSMLSLIFTFALISLAQDYFHKLMRDLPPPFGESKSDAAKAADKPSTGLNKIVLKVPLKASASKDSGMVFQASMITLIIYKSISSCSSFRCHSKYRRNFYDKRISRQK